MPTRCTAVTSCSGIRNSRPGHTHAGKPDKPDRTSGLPRALLRLPRSPISPKPDYASVPPWGLAAAIRLQFRLCVKVRIFRAIGVPAGGCRLTLLEAGKTALRIAPSVPASTGVQIESRQAALLPVNSRSRVGAGAPCGRAPRRDRSCQTSKQVRMNRGRAMGMAKQDS
jgi:hypothetical protein